MDPLTVLAVQTVARKRTVPAPLPQPPFCMCIVAPPRSGKSTMIVNMIRNRKFQYRWGLVCIISPTASFDQTYATLADREGTVIYNDPSLMDELLDSFCKAQEANGFENDMLVVVDDCVGHMGKSLEQLASRYRHYKISLIVASQQFRMIPPTVRTCAGYWALYKTWNAKEVDKMVEEFSGQFPSFQAVYERATARKYDFLYLDILDSRMHLNYTDEL